MAWAEVKKAINTNLNKALDTLITEKTNEVKTSVTGVQNTANAINNGVGASGNAANSGGATLFALVKYVVSTVASILSTVNIINTNAANAAKYLQRQNPLSGTSPEKSGTHNVVNLTGPGVFHLIELTTTATHNTQKFSVSIDGVALYSNIIVPASSSSLTLLQKDTYFKGSLVVTIISSTIASSKWSCHYSLYK